MDAISEVRSRVDAVGDGLERVADPRKRPRVLALLDPFDIAGHATRTILPTHPTPALAHLAYFAVLGALVATEVVEPPVALLMAAGHLMLRSHNRFIEEAADALEDGA